MANPWDNDIVVQPAPQQTQQPARRGNQVRYDNGGGYVVTSSQYTNESPTALLNQGYYPDASGTYVRTTQGEGPAPWANDTPVPVQDQVPLQSSPLTAFAQGAAEQIPFLDEAAAKVAGLLTGTPYSEVRALQNDISAQDRQQQGVARNLGGLAGFGAGLAAPGGGYVNAARGAQGVVRAGQLGGVYGALYGLGAGEGSLAERAPGGVIGGLTGAVAGAGIQQAGNTIAARLSGIAGAGTRPASRSAQYSQRVADFNRVGVEPTLAGVGSPTAQRTAQALAGNIMTEGPIGAASQRAREQTMAAVERIAGQYGQAEGRDATGRVLRSATEDAATRLRTEGGTLYEPVRALEANTTPIPLTNSAQAVQSQLEIFQTPAVSEWFTRNATDLAQFRDVLNKANNEVTFAEARQLRSIVGKMLSDPQVFNSQSERGLRALYGSLSEDIANGARQLGGEEAAAALSRADAFYAGARTRADSTLRQFYQSRGGREVTDAEAYNLLISQARTRGNRSSFGAVRQLRDSVTPQEWGDIAGGVIRTLGGEGDNFSIAKFATEFESLTPEARRIIFGGRGREREFADLQALARVARQQQQAGRFYNYSESGNTAGNIGTISGLVSALATGNIGLAAGIAGAGISGNALARILTSPGVARWLARPVNEAVPAAEALARRNPAFREWWSVSRDAVVRAVAQNDNLATLPSQAAAQQDGPSQ